MQNDIILTARERLGALTPLRRDCGRLCGASCCQADESGKGGMILFPGEETRYGAQTPWARISPGEIAVAGRPLQMLTCDGTCDRAERPLACRVFPLTPVALDDKIDVVLDVRAWPVCPLMPHGMKGLDAAFVAAVRAAAALLWEDSACRLAIEAMTEHLRKFME